MPVDSFPTSGVVWMSTAKDIRTKPQENPVILPNVIISGKAAFVPKSLESKSNARIVIIVHGQN